MYTFPRRDIKRQSSGVMWARARKPSCFNSKMKRGSSNGSLRWIGSAGQNGDKLISVYSTVIVKEECGHDGKLFTTMGYNRPLVAPQLGGGANVASYLSEVLRHRCPPVQAPRLGTSPHTASGCDRFVCRLPSPIREISKERLALRSGGQSFHVR